MCCFYKEPDVSSDNPPHTAFTSRVPQCSIQLIPATFPILILLAEYFDYSIVFLAVPKPDLDSYVFLRVKERQENILVEPETDEQR